MIYLNFRVSDLNKLKEGTVALAEEPEKDPQ